MDPYAELYSETSRNRLGSDKGTQVYREQDKRVVQYTGVGQSTPNVIQQGKTKRDNNPGTRK